MGELGEYFADRPFTIEGGRAQSPLAGDEQLARDSSGLCGRRCGSAHTGTGHDAYTLCIDSVGHDGPHLCGRDDHDTVAAGTP